MSRKFKFHENVTVIVGSLHEEQFTFFIYLAEFLKWDMFQKKLYENSKYFMRDNFFRMSIYFVEPCMPQMTIWRERGLLLDT
jgi:hypothetical protein